MSTYSPKRIVWEAIAFDCGRYLCRVEQDEDKNAQLTVTLQGYGRTEDLPIHTEPITVALDKLGGPQEDIEKWKKMCDKVIDFPKFRSSVSGLSAWNLQ